MYSLNKVQIIGNLGADPETRSMNNGGEVCTLNVACSEKWKSRDGETKERTEWIKVVLFAEHAVRFAKQYLRKGSKVYVEGKFQTRKWTDQDGKDRYSTEVVVQPYGGEIMGLDKPEGRGGYDPGGDFNRRGSGSDRDTGWGAGNQQSGFGRGGPSPFDSDLDDDVPF